MNFIARTVAAAVLAIGSFAASADIVKIGTDAFQPTAGLITFSEFAAGTVNPTYNPSQYGGNPATSPVVSFGGYFSGQSMGGNVCGGAATGCVVGSPTGTLSLAGGAPQTSIVNDGANPTSPVLSGSPIFNGPVAILFDRDVAGVGLDGGYFNAIGGTAITAFARDGTMLGQVANTALGIEFLGLVTSDGSEQIAGLLFSLVGDEPAGFGIDNLRFGLAGQVTVPTDPNGVPEPATLALSAFALLGAAAARRRKA